LEVFLLFIKKIFIVLMFSLIGCQVQIDPRQERATGPGPDPDSPLIGTKWFWDGGWGEVILYFENPETVLFYNLSRFAYSYDKIIRTGEAVSLGRFTVTENYELLNFSPTWRNFPHEANFARIR
jgi:hypothetical protein